MKEQGKLQNSTFSAWGSLDRPENGKEQNLEGYVKVCLKQSVQKGVPENGNTMCTNWSREQARQVKGLQWEGPRTRIMCVRGEYLGTRLNKED